MSSAKLTVFRGKESRGNTHAARPMWLIYDMDVRRQNGGRRGGSSIASGTESTVARARQVGEDRLAALLAGGDIQQPQASRKAKHFKPRRAARRLYESFTPDAKRERKRAEREDQAYDYLLGSVDRKTGEVRGAKIGWAFNPEDRRDQLQVGSLDRLVLLGWIAAPAVGRKSAEAQEKTLQAEFAADQIPGRREWFADSAELRARFG